MGIKTKTGSTAWSPASVLKIIKNEKYCGDLLQKKTVTPDYLTHKKSVNRDTATQIMLVSHHEPIIERALWDRAQEERRRRTAGNGPSPKRGNRYPLSGRIACAVCSSPFVCRTRKRRSGSAYRVWQRTCRHTVCQLREDWITKTVREIVYKHQEEIMPLLQPKPAETGSDGLASLLAELRRLSIKCLRLTDTYISGDITRDHYAELRGQYRSRISMLAERLNRTWHANKSAKDTSTTENAQTLASGTSPDDDFYLKLIDIVAVREDSTCSLKLRFLQEVQNIAYK
jgi:hypothetical protein